MKKSLAHFFKKILQFWSLVHVADVDRRKDDVPQRGGRRFDACPRWGFQILTEVDTEDKDAEDNDADDDSGPGTNFVKHFGRTYHLIDTSQPPSYNRVIGST